MVGRLENKVAIVTGGAGGIGAATGLMVCEQGARVVLVDSDAAAMDAAVSSIRGAVAGAQVLPLVADVGKEETAARAVAETKKAFGAIDVLVNLAGIRAYEPLAEARAETWERIIAVNLMSYAYFAREAMGDLRASGRGSIVNISSTHGVNPRAGMGQYDVTKAGIISLTKTLAFEEAKHGVRVNAVCPGLTLTPFHLRRAEAAGRTRADLDREAADGCLIGRWADAREVAYPILWLASDEASYVTGAVLMVDGGRFVKTGL
jgi:2-hydroxycyclohexanecarboxyl-CoA dehydrogenase